MSANELGLSESQYRAFEIFYPYAVDKTLKAARTNQRFVYYTSAETAMHIIRGQELWMRKSHVMNDYREIEHGFDCLNNAYKKNKTKMESLFDSLFPGFCGRLEGMFNNWLPHFRTDTYITCISEHDNSEDRHGRLSMWRAYGGTAGVAIVVNGGPFLRPTDALKAHASPVAYCDGEQAEKEFLRLLGNIEQGLEIVKSLGEEATRNYMFSTLRHAMLCMKHPGFHEEREWRVIYSPSFQKSTRIASAVESINGTPQPICKIPLKDVPEEGLIGLNLPTFIDRIIIGPSRFPAGIYDAFSALLGEAGVQNPASRIVVSDVPLRQ